MSKYLGNAMILKVENPADSGTYVKVFGSKSHTFSMANEQVDASDKDTNRWKSLVSAGDRTATVSMEGFVIDGAQFVLVNEASETDSELRYQLEYGNSKLVIGKFHIDSMEPSGGRNTLQEYSTTLSSSEEPIIGALTDFLLDENDANVTDEDNQYVQGL